MNSAPGRLTQISVICGSCRNRLRDPSVKVSAVCSAVAARRGWTAASGSGCGADSMTAGGTTELVDSAEIDIPGHQHLNAIAVVLGHRGRNAQRVLKHFARDILRGRGVIDDHTVAPAGGLHAGLHRAIDSGDQNRGAKALPEVSIDLPRQSR